MPPSLSAVDGADQCKCREDAKRTPPEDEPQFTTSHLGRCSFLHATGTYTILHLVFVAAR